MHSTKKWRNSVQPEIVPAVGGIEKKGTQITNTVGRVAIPGHAPQLTAASDDQVSGFLNRAGANVDTLLIEVGIANPNTIVEDVTFQLFDGVTSLGRPPSTAQTVQALQSQVKLAKPEQVLERHIDRSDVIGPQFTLGMYTDDAGKSVAYAERGNLFEYLKDVEDVRPGDVI